MYGIRDEMMVTFNPLCYLYIHNRYSLNHPTTGYCQGMSDLASPLLYTMGDEAQAYICFCSLMDRIKPNFSTDGEAMSLKVKTHIIFEAI